METNESHAIQTETMQKNTKSYKELQREYEGNTKECEGMRRNTSEQTYQGIPMDTMEYQGIRRSTRACNGTPRTAKEYKKIQENTKTHQAIQGNARKYQGNQKGMLGILKYNVDARVSFDQPTLCICGGSGERNGLRICDRNRAEHDKNKVGIEETRMSTQIKQRAQKEFKRIEGARRNTREYTEARRIYRVHAKEYTEECNRMPGNTRTYGELQVKTKQYMGIQQNARDCKGTPGNTREYRGIHG